MFKMVFQAVLFTGLAIAFILTKSDGLRSAAQTGDFTRLASMGSGAGADSLADGSYGGDYAGSVGQPWYVKFDPRRLWRERPKQIRLNTKTIRVEPQQVSVRDDLAAQLAAKRLEADVVSVVKLD